MSVMSVNVCSRKKKKVRWKKKRRARLHLPLAMVNRGQILALVKVVGCSPGVITIWTAKVPSRREKMVTSMSLCEQPK